MPGRLFVISGPSGVGKGTLVKRVMERKDGLWLSVSATTRPIRAGETAGVSYVYLTDEAFSEEVAKGGFLEWARVHDNRYGTLRAPVEEKLAEGLDVILEIDPQGAFQVKDSFPDAFLVFVKPPSFEELRRRLTGRGTETPEQVEKRLETAKLEMQQEHCYNYSLVNDDIERSTAELLSVIEENG